VVAVAVVLGIVGLFVTKFLLRNFKSVEKEAGQDSNPMLDADVSRSLAKTVKHLQRVRNSSEGEMQDKAASLLSEVEELQDQTLKQITTNTDSAELQQVEKVFVYLQILTACLVAFAHGSNDVANAIGPLSAAYQAVSTGMIAAKSSTPGWALLLGGAGIVIGLATWGWKVIKTVGEKITELTPSRGFCAEFAAAITILLASVLPIGLPISTTHTLVGAVLGVGLARGINALNLKTMRDIVAGWAITIPAGAILCMIFYFLLKLLFIDWAVFGSLV
jgi:phosphate/sulfate permease